MSILITIPDPTIEINIPEGFAEARLTHYRDYTKKGAEKWRAALFEVVHKYIPKTHQGVYLFYDSNNELIYVGRTINTQQRIQAHIEQAKFKNEINKIKLIYVDNVCDQEIYEAYIINKLMPKLNVAKVNRK